MAGRRSVASGSRSHRVKSAPAPSFTRMTRPRWFGQTTSDEARLAPGPNYFAEAAISLNHVAGVIDTQVHRRKPIWCLNYSIKIVSPSIAHRTKHCPRNAAAVNSNRHCVVSLVYAVRGVSGRVHVKHLTEHHDMFFVRAANRVPFTFNPVAHPIRGLVDIAIIKVRNPIANLTTTGTLRCENHIIVPRQITRN